MPTIPASAFVVSREEWPDADFDLPDDLPLHTASTGIDEDEEDWDVEMNFGKTGGAKVVPPLSGSESSSSAISQSPATITIRPPMRRQTTDDEEDEGVSTIKANASTVPASQPTPVEDDFEDAFALPADLTQLSLAPLSLNHRASKHSLEWGDKDQTSSSHSSDAYSTLGFADASPSNSASSASLPDTETEEEEEDDLDGLVIPPALFDSGKQLSKMLELKKKALVTGDQLKVASPDPEDDMEMGLIIDDDVDLSPSRLLINAQQSKHQSSRSNIPVRASTLRPPSRAKMDRAKSPVNPPPSSVRQLQRLRLSPSPPLPAPIRSQTQTFQALGAPAASSSSLLATKPGSLRGQKSHSGLKPPTPPGTLRKMTRKASLSSLIETSNQASGSGTVAAGPKARYEEPTAASRAKTHKNSMSRMNAQDFKVPPTRPSTPSSNTAALRLTMPTQSRLKLRPALSAVFSNASGTASAAPSPIERATSPQNIPRPPSSASLRSRAPIPVPVAPVAPKLLRRPKRQRTYGDGTELDDIEDLPLDREKEGRFRVQPKGYGNRVPGGTYSSKSAEKEKEKAPSTSSGTGTIRRKKRDGSSGSTEPASALPAPIHTLRRTSRIELSKALAPSEPTPKKKKRAATPTNNQQKRKPTLIRNLGSANAPKVVGDMRWNPQLLRWEGNDQVLRDFDVAVGTSTRPALITQLTGSSVGSPVGGFASGARIVGNMIFDPTRMCWISTLPPDEDEPDVFENLADDEDDTWVSKGGTIRASSQGTATTTTSDASSTCGATSSASSIASPRRSHSRAFSDSGSDRGSRASMVYDVDETFAELCRLAEERHRQEMRDWRIALSVHDAFDEPDRSYLYALSHHS
ncbi:hypothetical protein AX16_006443 [Volvariella volvacea WC 439]|nr:hypothetical protein AX16_006443 [Volvariella volvacea WC 439]